MSDSTDNITQTPVTIHRQGAPRVGIAAVHARGENCVLISLDMQSKRCVISSSTVIDGAPGLYIFAGKDSLHLDPGRPREACTEVSFPEFAGWRVWCGDGGRYSIGIALIKEAME